MLLGISAGLVLSITIEGEWGVALSSVCSAGFLNLGVHYLVYSMSELGCQFEAGTEPSTYLYVQGTGQPLTMFTIVFGNQCPLLLSASF